MERVAIDLHTHSTASDGLESPENLVRLAAGQGLSVLALTDHDTIAGIGRAAAALPAGLTLVPGAEISCQVEVAGAWVSLHVLAYLFDPAEPAFAAARAQVREHRATRARRMVDRLTADGHPVRWERVLELAAGTVGRPHIAAVMVETGLIPEVAAAFSNRWIGAGGPYWVGKEQPDVWEALRLIHGAGGVSVFAHPFASRRGVTVGPEVIEAMAKAGLTGLEVDHPDHLPVERRRLRGLAAELSLVATGSSDFHGASKPQGLGAETTSRETYEALVSAARGAVPITASG
ncbi:PHP domain-containing protein [Frankia sp. CcWB3]